MAMGAIFAALNTMYSAVSTRTMEIATLRAIGFGSGAVVISVLVEALLLAIVGALVGAFPRVAGSSTATPSARLRGTRESRKLPSSCASGPTSSW